jgi:ribosome maturation factor RimP
MMKRSLFSALALASVAVLNAAAVLPAPARAADPPPAKAKARQIQGQIVSTDKEQVVVKTRDNEQLTVRVRPQTKFLLKDKAVQFTDLRVGANVTIDAVVEEDRPFAESIVIVDEAAPAAEATLVEGEIVRVVGTDQVIVRTPERKEVTVFVDPQTTFQLEEKTATFTDLRTGMPVRVDVNVKDGRHMARQIAVPKRK